MTSAPKRRLDALSEQLSVPRQDPGQFEGIARIPVISKNASNGPRVLGKVIIITGANSTLGIGRASAHQFAANGAKAIFICDFADNYLETHKREINSLYPDVEVHTRKMDAGDEADVKSVVDEAMEKYGRLDVFFANAGILGSTTRITESSGEDFMKVMRVNALGYVISNNHSPEGGFGKQKLTVLL
ncbi:hypothetical protein MBLNU457_4988t2 [Dothideomycetes sp. NU457]